MPKLGLQLYLNSGAVVRDFLLGHYVEIGEGSRVLESTFSDYSYTDRYADIAYSNIGKFANIAAFSRLNPSEHPHARASLHHFMYRSQYYWDDEPDDAERFAWRRSRPVTPGHDTWIGQQKRASSCCAGAWAAPVRFSTWAKPP